MRAIIVRHYRTRSNESGRIMGWFDSPRGREWKADVDYVSACLKERAIAFDGVFSSDLGRSRKTARLYADRLGIDEIGDSRELNEINYGKLQKMKKLWAPRYFPHHKKNADLVYPGGESFRQMQARSVAFIGSLALDHPGQTLLIVTHAGVIRGLVSHCLGLDLGENLQRGISFRYIGDLRFDGERCAAYDELGEPSGFVRDGVVDLPTAGTASTQ